MVVMGLHHYKFNVPLYLKLHKLLHCHFGVGIEQHCGGIGGDIFL